METPKTTALALKRRCADRLCAASPCCILYLLAGLGVFFLTLVSPFSALANGYLFSAHMVQHILLVLIVPALLLLSLRGRSRFVLHSPILVIH